MVAGPKSISASRTAALTSTESKVRRVRRIRRVRQARQLHRVRPAQSPKSTVSMNEDKAARYHRLGRRAGILSTIWTAVILLALLPTGASLALREWAAHVAGGDRALIVALYVCILSLFLDAATLPFSLYRGFLL